MTDMYIIVVTVAAAAHFAFLGYLIFGGFVALRWPHTMWLHILAACWGFVSLVWHLPCPLTVVERWGREQGGMAPLPPRGFNDHYIIGVLFPTDAETAMQLVAFATIGVSWALFVAVAVRGWSSRHRRLVPHGGGAG